ncbi:MAG: hypothetical protein ISP86_01685 [Shewanellaceae bacterium]|nr:hypothetical protein [Shewanellaceae bacterium]
MNPFNLQSTVGQKTWWGVFLYGLLWLSGVWFSKSEWVLWGLPLWFVLAGVLAPVCLMLYVIWVFRGRDD